MRSWNWRRSIGSGRSAGPSAGAIAAAFAAAAEYSRSVRKDPTGFLRMQAYCEELPDRLASLFQPYPQFAGLMRGLLIAQSGGGLAPLWGLLAGFWLSALAGGAIGGALLCWAHAGGWGVTLGVLVGVLTALAVRIATLVFLGLPKTDFGLCSGLTQPGRSKSALTDWIHGALQDIAFADPERVRPLTFGDLTGPDEDHPRINVKMMTTNLSMGRPYTLPNLNLHAAFDRAAWSRLFPRTVIDHLTGVSEPWRGSEARRSLPKPKDLPLLVAVRMSLSFPFLFSAVPVIATDFYRMERRAAADLPADEVDEVVLFTDGGISSNFPIHLFDTLLPGRPTFALSLDELPAYVSDKVPSEPAQSGRVFIPQAAGEGYGQPIRATRKVGDFASGILGAAKDWQDNTLSSMVGQRERIAHIMLSKTEGGLNLTMPRERSRMLMRYGHEVGAAFAGGALNFNEHRWRRALVAYQPLARLIWEHEAAWNGPGVRAVAGELHAARRELQELLAGGPEGVSPRAVGPRAAEGQLRAAHRGREIPPAARAFSEHAAAVAAAATSCPASPPAPRSRPAWWGRPGRRPAW